DPSRERVCAREGKDAWPEALGVRGRVFREPDAAAGGDGDGALDDALPHAHQHVDQVGGGAGVVRDDLDAIADVQRIVAGQRQDGQFFRYPLDDDAGVSDHHAVAAHQLEAVRAPVAAEHFAAHVDDGGV